MNQNFDKCLHMLLHHEGGFVNHPSDPGGMTNLGITKRTYDEFHGTDIDEEGMHRRNYWDRCRCGDLPSGVDWAVMDASVNHGTGRAAKFLQKAVMVEQDGAIGPRTIMAVNDNEPTEIISRMAVYRDAFFRSLSTFDTFGEGWIRRNDETRTSAIALGRG